MKMKLVNILRSLKDKFLYLLIGIPVCTLGILHFTETWTFPLVLYMPLSLLAILGGIYYLLVIFSGGRVEWIKLDVNDTLNLIFLPFIELFIIDMVRVILRMQVNYGWPDIFLFIFFIAFFLGSTLILKGKVAEDRFWGGIKYATYPAALVVLSLALAEKSEYFAVKGCQFAAVAFILSAILTFFHRAFLSKENDKRVSLVVISVLTIVGLGFLFFSFMSQDSLLEVGLDINVTLR